MTTTAFTLDGYRILESKGVVRGVIVRSRSVIGTIGAGLQTLVGGNISLFTELCERTREDAFQLMLEHARKHGANTVYWHPLRRDRSDGWCDRGAVLRHRGRGDAVVTGRSHPAPRRT
jgi:uncharacterized protein YbjQ (UPF0145 family)